MYKSNKSYIINETEQLKLDTTSNKSNNNNNNNNINNNTHLLTPITTKPIITYNNGRLYNNSPTLNTTNNKNNNLSTSSSSININLIHDKLKSPLLPSLKSNSTTNLNITNSSSNNHAKYDKLKHSIVDNTFGTLLSTSQSYTSLLVSPNNELPFLSSEIKNDSNIGIKAISENINEIDKLDDIDNNYVSTSHIVDSIKHILNNDLSIDQFKSEFSDLDYSIDSLNKIQSYLKIDNINKSKQLSYEIKMREILNNMECLDKPHRFRTITMCIFLEQLVKENAFGSYTKALILIKNELYKSIFKDFNCEQADYTSQLLSAKPYFNYLSESLHDIQALKRDYQRMSTAAINLSITLKKSKQTTNQLLGKYSVSSLKVLFHAWKKQTERTKSVKSHMKNALTLLDQFGAKITLPQIFHAWQRWARTRILTRLTQAVKIAEKKAIDDTNILNDTPRTMAKKRVNADETKTHIQVTDVFDVAVTKVKTLEAENQRLKEKISNLEFNNSVLSEKVEYSEKLESYFHDKITAKHGAEVETIKELKELEKLLLVAKDPENQFSKSRAITPFSEARSIVTPHVEINSDEAAFNIEAKEENNDFEVQEEEDSETQVHLTEVENSDKGTLNEFINDKKTNKNVKKKGKFSTPVKAVEKLNKNSTPVKNLNKVKTMNSTVSTLKKTAQNKKYDDPLSPTLTKTDLHEPPEIIESNSIDVTGLKEEDLLKLLADDFGILLNLEISDIHWSKLDISDVKRLILAIHAKALSLKSAFLQYASINSIGSSFHLSMTEFLRFVINCKIRQDSGQNLLSPSSINLVYMHLRGKTIAHTITEIENKSTFGLNKNHVQFLGLNFNDFLIALIMLSDKKFQSIKEIDKKFCLLCDNHVLMYSTVKSKNNFKNEDQMKTIMRIHEPPLLLIFRHFAQVSKSNPDVSESIIRILTQIDNSGLDTTGIKFSNVDYGSENQAATINAYEIAYFLKVTKLYSPLLTYSKMASLFIGIQSEQFENNHQLLYPEFVEFLVLICIFRNPDPFMTLYDRFHIFLLRDIYPPLMKLKILKKIVADIPLNVTSLLELDSIENPQLQNSISTVSFKSLQSPTANESKVELSLAIPIEVASPISNLLLNSKDETKTRRVTTNSTTLEKSIKSLNTKLPRRLSGNFK